MIVVTGMHRSGTSFVCQLLASLGVDFGSPDRFLAPDDWNAAGYFEARDVLDLNSRLITGYPRTQGAIRRLLSQVAYLRMPSIDAVRRRARPLGDQLDAIGVQYADLAVKDPRFCVTLPVWQEHAEISRIVIGVRHPTAVVRSLHRRQRVPHRVGLRFWAYHVESLLCAVPRGEGFFLRFESLRSASAMPIARRLAAYLWLDVSEEQIAAALTTNWRSDLVHHDRGPRASLGPAIDGLWERLQERVRTSCEAFIE